MIEILTIADLSAKPDLADSMFRDRADQFKQRHGWPVHVNPLGHEFDQYDDASSHYVIAHDGMGKHLGSLRLRDIKCNCMLSEHFGSLLIGSPPISDRTLEVTRFCISPNNTRPDRNVSQELFERAYEFALDRSYEGWVGVFSTVMLRVYRSNRWPLKILSECRMHGEVVRLGHWSTDDFISDAKVQDRVLAEAV